MLTEQERAFLDALAKAPIPTDVKGLRQAMDTFAPMMNSNPPEIGAFHEASRFDPVSPLMSRCPRATGLILSSCICTAADGSEAARGRIASSGCNSPKRVT